MVIHVCVGSSCHIKNSYAIIDKFKTAIARHDLEDSVELKASFCLDNCMNAVSFKIDDGPCESVSLDTFDDVFRQAVLRKLDDYGTDSNSGQ
ncbi:MAG: (2Fe-2S) ferredoxin domain-containing protein [Candidatus Izemoplasmataceae bacterium]